VPEPIVDPSLLTTLAEISVALAGFSAIVVSFRQRNSGRWLEADADRFNGMVLHAMMALLFCLLPSVIGLFSHDPLRVWGIASGVLGLQIVGHALIAIRLATTDLRGRTILALGAVLGVFLVASGMGLSPMTALEAYLLGVLWHVAHSSVLFVWLIWIPAGPIERE